MKKLLLALLALPLMILASCSDDDLPNVNFKVSYEGATNVDGTLYAVQGDTLAITGVTVTPVNSKHTAAIAGVSYFWDGIPAGSTIVEPFTAAFQTQYYSVGTHVIQIRANVLEVDCTPAVALITLPMQIVSSASDIPAGGTPGGTIEPPASIED